MADRDVMVVTGTSSFIGVHLAIHFAGIGYTVVGTYADEHEKEDELRRARLEAAASAGAKIEPLDFTDRDATETFISGFRPDYWIHHAGWAVAYGSKDYDLERANAVNVSPLGRIYSSLSAVGCRGVIVTGTSAEYSDSVEACRESDCCLPSMPYGLSKHAETIRAGQLAIDYRLPTRVARVFIPYGAYDAPGKLLSTVISSLREGKPVDLSPCEQKRDFISVDDLVEGYAALVRDLERDEFFDIFNLCSGEAVTLKELLLKIAETIGADSSLLRFGAIEMRPGEPPVSYGSRDKAGKILGWHPRPLEEGLRTHLI